MAEEILLDYQINRPYVSTTREETEIKVLLKVNASEALRACPAAQAAMHTHLVMVLDVSSSMRVREIEALKEAAQAAIDELRPGDFVSVIAFQTVVYEIVEPTRIEDGSTKAMIKRKVSVIDQFQGGGTNMEYALLKASHHFSFVPDERLVKRIMVFTDGQITGPVDTCLRQAADISARGIGIDAMGFGPEFDYKFMQRLVAGSNGHTEKIDRPEDIKRAFAERVQAVTSAIAKNVRLDLTFTPQVRAGRGWRTSPEITYLGKIALPGEERTISIPIGTIERDKEYAYLVTCTVPQRPAGKVRVIKAELFYDIPGMQIVGGSSLQSVIVDYTDDWQLASELRGEVERVYDEAEIGRMIEGLDLALSRGAKQDASAALDALAERYRELGDEAMHQHYIQLKGRYIAEGKISQEDMNFTRHKSTQKRSSGVQLVDASSLI
jgi:Ca-activated chloride channel family protein